MYDLLHVIDQRNINRYLEHFDGVRSRVSMHVRIQ